MRLPLLPAWQRFNSLVVTPDNSSLYIGIGIVVLFILLIIIAGRRGIGSSRRTIQSDRKPMRRGTFRRRASAMGLSKTQIRALKNLMNRHFRGNPDQLFSNQAVLDKLLSAGMEDITFKDSTADVKENQRHTLYQIRQIVMRNRHRRMVLRSTKDLKPGQKMTLISLAGTNYSARLLNYMKNGLGIEMPEETEELKRLGRGSPVQVHLQLSNGQAFSFPSKVLGHIQLRHIKGVLLKHNAKITEARQRQFQRKKLDRLCYFYSVRVHAFGTGRSQVKKAVVETKNGLVGTILDVSAGGCSIRIQNPLPRGGLIRVDFETSQERSVRAFGKVVNLSQDASVGRIMHIQFTKMSRPHLNAINHYVHQI